MPSAFTNQSIADGMLGCLRSGGAKAAVAQTQPCGSGFDVTDFAVTYPGNQLMANVGVAGMPAGATLLGVTVGATPDMGSGATYCMAVAADSNGLSLPVSVLATSTATSFPAPTAVVGFVVLSYSVDGEAEQQCLVTQSFTVGR
jgi:hypothetical protein